MTLLTAKGRRRRCDKGVCMYVNVNRSGKLPTSFFISPFVSTSPPNGENCHAGDAMFERKGGIFSSIYFEYKEKRKIHEKLFWGFPLSKFKWRGFLHTWRDERKAKKLRSRLKLLYLLSLTLSLTTEVGERKIAFKSYEICIHLWENNMRVCIMLFYWDNILNLNILKLSISQFYSNTNNR